MLKINTWKELINFFDKFNWSANYGRDWIFRGESNESRTISPSLERLHKDKLGSMPKVEELSLLQHYGAPTRLVDFTYSWYIALFFVIESLSDKNSSLLCINLQELKKESKLMV